MPGEGNACCAPIPLYPVGDPLKKCVPDEKGDVGEPYTINGDGETGDCIPGDVTGDGDGANAIPCEG